MEHFAVRVPEDTIEAIEEYREENGLTKSEAGRELLVNGLEHDRITTENQRLRNEKRTIINQREEHGELVEYVKEERRIQQRREERRDAPVWRRAAWWVLGRG